ncbi:MAG: hypothetical protein RSC08_00780 [Oscillospiraceae bacterium]
MRDYLEECLAEEDLLPVTRSGTLPPKRRKGSEPAEPETAAAPETSEEERVPEGDERVLLRSLLQEVRPRKESPVRPEKARGRQRVPPAAGGQSIPPTADMQGVPSGGKALAEQLARSRRTLAAARLEGQRQPPAKQRRAGEIPLPGPIPAAGADPMALDRLAEREARRYDGGFTLY